MFSFLYKNIFKPLAFSQDPERVHDSITAMGELLGKFSLTRQMTRKMFAFEDPRLEREIAGIKFKNPIGLAAGFDKNARLIDILPYVGFGFAEFGSITAKPSEGNPKPRLWRLPESQALVVNYGLMNDGVDAVLERVKRSRTVRARRAWPEKFSPAELGSPKRRPALSEYIPQRPSQTMPASDMSSFENFSKPAPTIVGVLEEDVLKHFRVGISVAKTNCKETAADEAGIDDYFECFQKVNASGLADYITINVSCPNAYGGEPFTTPDKFERLSSKLKEIRWTVPVFVKLPCDYSNEELDGMLEVAVKHGYSAVILSNLTKDRINNPIIQKSDLSKIGKGGISGKPTFERSNALISHAREALRQAFSSTQSSADRRGDKMAVIGCGGVFSGEDAKLKLDAGADLIQMITGMIYEGPQVIGQINKHLAFK